MKCNLIIDGSYMLNKIVFPLHKSNILYGNLETALMNTYNMYEKFYLFNRVYFVSDLSSKSWRKRIYNDYKGTRTKNLEIDWEYVNNSYRDFKEKLKSNSYVTILEADEIEGDDWITYIINKYNKLNVSNMVISNDYDIKQLIKYDIVDNEYINFMANEMSKGYKLFLPENYKIYFDHYDNKKSAANLFSDFSNKDSKFKTFFSNFIEKSETILVNNSESLFIKLIIGDKSDNIPSIYISNNRGIGEKGAITILEKYKETHNGIIEIDLDDKYEIDILFNDIAEIIIEMKKTNEKELIINNLKNNYRIITLNINDYPEKVLNRIQRVYENNRR